MRPIRLKSLFLSLLAILVMATSCSFGGGSGNRPPEETVKAKVMYTDLRTGLQTMFIKNISPVYEPGDYVVIGQTRYLVISVNRPAKPTPKYAGGPEDAINGPNFPFSKVHWPIGISQLRGTLEQPVLLTAFKAGDQLYIQYYNPER